MHVRVENKGKGAPVAKNLLCLHVKNVTRCSGLIFASQKY